jgi:hypothetical protein
MPTQVKTRGGTRQQEKKPGISPNEEESKREKCLQVIRGDFPVGSRRVITFTFFFDYFPSKIK